MTVKMTPDSIGTWLLHCHVNDHMVHGMEALYNVGGLCIIASPIVVFLAEQFAIHFPILYG